MLLGVALVLLASTSASAFLPQARLTAPHVVTRSGVAPALVSKPLSRQSCAPQMRAASVAAASPAPGFRAAPRLLWALLTSCLSVLCFAARALAAVERAAPYATKSVLLTTQTKKYLIVGGFFGLMYVFRNKDLETTPVISYVEEESAAPAQTDAAEPAADPLNDVALLGDLRARMLSLATEEESSDEPAPEPTEPSDSTDGWGVGSTAVLEPPREDAPPATDLPLGFPLRGNEPEFDFEVDTEPAADEASIAMLERMFGSRSED